MTDEEYVVYTHDEYGVDREFVISDIEQFFKNQENLPKFVEEMQEKLGLQKDLKYGIENNFLVCNDKETGEDISEMQLEYLGVAIESNIKVIRKAREFLGMSPEPEPKPSKLSFEFMKRNRNFN